MKGRLAFLIWKQTGSKPRLCFGSPIRLLADPYHLHHRTRGPVGPLSDSRRPKMTKKSRKPAKLPKTATPARRAKAAKHAKAATQTAPAKKTTPAKPPGKVHVLFGADEYAKPRAARFTGADLEPLTKAAAAMHLRLVEVTEPEVAEIAAKLPAGRLHANGKGLVPYVKADLYTSLMYAPLAGEPPQANP